MGLLQAYSASCPYTQYDRSGLCSFFATGQLCYRACSCVIALFFHSLSHGVIPKSWKRAAIIPIYMSGDKTFPSNYRQIYLTSVICKVLERIIRKQVFSLLDQKGCLNTTQMDLGLAVPGCQRCWMILIILCTC